MTKDEHLKKHEEESEVEEEEESEAEEEEAEDEEVEDESESELVDLNFDIDPNANIGDLIQSEANAITSGNVDFQTVSDEHRYDHIKDPNVRMLMTMNLNSTSKDEVVNFLLQNKALEKKSVQTKRGTKGKVQFNIQSQYNAERLNSDPNYKTVNYHISAEKENPEYANDFGTAVKKLLSKMTKDPASNQDILKILISEDRINAEIEKLSVVKRENIDMKVGSYLSRKQKKIESIAEKMNEEFQQKYTFSPELVTVDPTSETAQRRKLDQFLNDQYTHTRKIQEKVLQAQEENKKKELESLRESHPKVDENSKKIFKEKFRSEEPSHLRLYNKSYKNIQKDVVKESKTEFEKKDASEENKNSENKDKVENNKTKPASSSPGKKQKKKKQNKVDELLEKKEKEKKPISKKEAEEYRVKKLYQDASVQNTNKEKLKIKIMQEEENAKDSPTGYLSNKFVLQNVMDRYRIVTSEIFNSLIASTQNTSDGNTMVVNEGDNTLNINNVQLNRFTLIQLNQVFYEFGFSEFIHKENSIELTQEGEEANIKNNAEQISVESKLKQNEKKLICDVWDALKDSEGYVNVDHLFIFVLAVINLYEYYLYTSYKKNKRYIETTKKVTEKKNAKSKKSDKQKQKFDISEVMAKINADINAKIVKQNKYGAFDDQNNFVIPLDKAKIINKDFSIFYINFMNSKSKREKREPEVNPIFRVTYTPQINEKSQKLSEEYRKKVMTDENETLNSHNTSISKKDKERMHLEYFDRLIQKKKKKESEYAKLKEDISNRETIGCTFKPKINEEYHASREGIEIEDGPGRIDRLYKMGIQIISNRKDKPRDEIEKEIYGKECTFKPNMTKEQKTVKEEVKFHNDIYTEKSYELLYNRLKNGRVERMIKDSVHERGEFPQQIDEYLNKKKDSVMIPITTGRIKPSLPTKPTKSKVEEKTAAKINVKQNTNINQNANISNEENDIFRSNPYSKDSIPLLIIDVNIRPGVKKKIYVFDGDSAEGLAEKFAEEHELDLETKGKLQVLIQSHMSRLLMRIDEENQSVSEKSSTHKNLES